MTIRPIDIQRHEVSAKRRFDEMKFRENDQAPILTKSYGNVKRTVIT